MADLNIQEDEILNICSYMEVNLNQMGEYLAPEIISTAGGPMCLDMFREQVLKYVADLRSQYVKNQSQNDLRMSDLEGSMLDAVQQALSLDQRATELANDMYMRDEQVTMESCNVSLTQKEEVYALRKQLAASVVKLRSKREESQGAHFDHLRVCEELKCLLQAESDSIHTLQGKLSLLKEQQQAQSETERQLRAQVAELKEERDKAQRGLLFGKKQSSETEYNLREEIVRPTEEQSRVETRVRGKQMALERASSNPDDLTQRRQLGVAAPEQPLQDILHKFCTSVKAQLAELTDPRRQVLHSPNENHLQSATPQQPLTSARSELRMFKDQKESDLYNEVSFARNETQAELGMMKNSVRDMLANVERLQVTKEGVTTLRAAFRTFIGHYLEDRELLLQMRGDLQTFQTELNDLHRLFNLQKPRLDTLDGHVSTEQAKQQRHDMESAPAKARCVYYRGRQHPIDLDLETDGVVPLIFQHTAKLGKRRERDPSSAPDYHNHTPIKRTRVATGSIVDDPDSYTVAQLPDTVESNRTWNADAYLSDVDFVATNDLAGSQILEDRGSKPETTSTRDEYGTEHSPIDIFDSMDASAEPLGATSTSKIDYPSAGASLTQLNIHTTHVFHLPTSDDPTVMAEAMLSLFYPMWDVVETERAIMKNQWISAFSGVRRKKTFLEAVQQVDRHVLGDWNTEPPLPRKCMMAQLTSSQAGNGGPNMTQNTCRGFCRRRLDRICQWALLAPTIRSGYQDRVNGRLASERRAYNLDMNNLTITLGGKQVRYLLFKRKQSTSDEAVPRKLVNGFDLPTMN